jgi:hypothetical protein
MSKNTPKPACVYTPYPLQERTHARLRINPPEPRTSPQESGGEERSTGSEKNKRTRLNPDDIVPETLHRAVGWDVRHHFMAEKIIDRFGLVLPRDRELVRQLAIIYVLGGHAQPPE